MEKKVDGHPLTPLENGAEIVELLKFHCKLFAKVSGIFLRSCSVASTERRGGEPEPGRSWVGIGLELGWNRAGVGLESGWSDAGAGGVGGVGLELSAH